MFLVYTLKVVGFLAAIAVVWLLESGDRLLALAALPMLITMWLASRQRAQRRARRDAEK